MRNELKDTYRKLEQKQSENGGFAWFEGGKENVYITTHIVAGFGHLAKMGLGDNADISVDLETIPDCMGLLSSKAGIYDLASSMRPRK